MERITVHQLDVADQALFPPDAQRQFFMDIQLAPYTAETAPPIEFEGDGEALAGSVTWMRDKWRELMGKMYGTEDRRVIGSSPDRRMDSVVAEMKDRIKEGSPLRKKGKPLAPAAAGPAAAAVASITEPPQVEGTAAEGGSEMAASAATAGVDTPRRPQNRREGADSVEPGQEDEKAPVDGTPLSQASIASSDSAFSVSTSPSPRDLSRGKLLRLTSSGRIRSNIGRKRSRDDDILQTPEATVPGVPSPFGEEYASGSDRPSEGASAEKGLSGRSVQRALEPELLEASRQRSRDLEDTGGRAQLGSDSNLGTGAHGKAAQSEGLAAISVGLRDQDGGSGVDAVAGRGEEDSEALSSAPVTPEPQREPSSQHYSPEQLRSLQRARKGKSRIKSVDGSAAVADVEESGNDLSEDGEAFDGLSAPADGAVPPLERQRALRADEGLSRQSRKGRKASSVAADGTVVNGEQEIDGLEERRVSHQEAGVSLPGISAEDLRLLQQRRGRKAAGATQIDVHASADGKLAPGDQAAMPGKPSEGEDHSMLFLVMHEVSANILCQRGGDAVVTVEDQGQAECDFSHPSFPFPWPLRRGCSMHFIQ